MTDDLISLIYVSSATHLFSEGELVDLLNLSREKNRRLKLTGMLLYKGGNFLQVLEGPEQAVMSLYETICNDPRHKNVTLLEVERIGARAFPNWEMGFANVDSLDIKSLPGYTPFLEEGFTSPVILGNQCNARLMLETFKDSIR